MPVCQISSADSRCNTSRLSDCERCILASHTLMHQLVQGTPYAPCSTGTLQQQRRRAYWIDQVLIAQRPNLVLTCH